MATFRSLFEKIIFKNYSTNGALPQFPQFKKLELSDKEAVEKITSKYPPYSDFNFVSMWSWDIKEDMRISELHGNLVVRFTDYVTGEPFYSFLGDNKVNETAQALLDLSKEEGLELKLKLIPEHSMVNLDNSKFKIEEDRDNFDYILDNESLQLHKSKDSRYHANLYERLKNECRGGLEVRTLDLSEGNHKKEILTLVEKWVKNKIDQNKNTVNVTELDAIQKFFLIGASENLSIGVFYNNNLIGCSINDPAKDDFSLCHFMKADSSFKGIYSCLFIETGKIMLSVGKRYMNIEQDLGLSNLRQSKKSFDPAYFLKKYIVTDIV